VVCLIPGVSYTKLVTYRYTTVITQFMNKEIHYKSPPLCDIVIFEKTGSQRIRNLIIPDLDVFIFDSSLDNIFISFQVIRYFIKSLSLFKINYVKSYKNVLRGFGAHFRLIYIASVIRAINPKIVITLIDNHTVFHWLCQYYVGAEFIAIQNGTRTKGEIMKVKSKIRLQHYFCFGNYEKDLFSGLGYKINNYYPVGSLLAGKYITKHNGKNKPTYDICIVSAWRGNIELSDDVKCSMSAMRKMDMMLSKYIEASKTNASIIMRSEPNSDDRKIAIYGDEKEYFKNIYPESVVLIDPDIKHRNIYSEMLKAVLIISMGSTAPREVFGIGKKILYCDFTDSNLYNDYNDTILFKENNYELLKQRINELLKMPGSEYEENTREYASYMMNNDFDRPPHHVIREMIDNYLCVSGS
jgi:surface carbohydrate biosynthesis protein